MSGVEREYVISMDALESFYDEPGERGWILEGYKHGLSATSVIITETAPQGGPPLHSHHSEEIHVLPPVACLRHGQRHLHCRGALHC